MNKQIRESILFRNSLIEWKNKQNLMLYLWQMNTDRSMGCFNYFKIIPYELIREISEFLILGKTYIKYYQIVDNYHFYKFYKRFGHSRIWIEKRMSSMYIGKCLETTRFDIIFPIEIKKKITKYIDIKNTHALWILSKLNKKRYQISYVGWPDSFNELVSRPQISLISSNIKDQLLNIERGSFIECQHPIDKRYYNGLVTKIHRDNSVITGVDVIINNKSRGWYAWFTEIPLYSSQIALMGTHNIFGKPVSLFLKYKLSWGYITYMINKEAYYKGDDHPFDYLDVIEYTNVEFKFKTRVRPPWNPMSPKSLEDTIEIITKKIDGFK